MSLNPSDPPPPSFSIEFACSSASPRVRMTRALDIAQTRPRKLVANRMIRKRLNHQKPTTYIISPLQPKLKRNRSSVATMATEITSFEDTRSAVIPKKCEITKSLARLAFQPGQVLFAGVSIYRSMSEDTSSLLMRTLLRGSSIFRVGPVFPKRSGRRLFL